jgi:cellulose synthase/poly-beta-1,6-N-acetylglucosamine synthase-like glycosyltransferase
MFTWILFTLPPALPLALTLCNLFTWRPTYASGLQRRSRTSALVPARNEAAGIAACVEALLAEPFDEVIVCDDRSTDATPQILASLAEQHPRLRVIHGIPLPPGLVGKAHACHQLAAAARGDLLVFVDADTRLRPGALDHVRAGLDDTDLASFLPHQEAGSPGEHLALSLLHLTYLSWLPLRLVRATRDPRVLAANGQIVAVWRDAYMRFGGYGAVARELVDDMALCRAAKNAGLRVAFLDGARVATCRMYQSGREAWEGYSKNLYEGIGGHPAALATVVALHLTCFVLPWVALPFAPGPAAVGIGMNLLQRALLARRFGHPWWIVPTHPLGVLALCALAVNSWRWSMRGAIRWRGRVYHARTERGAA